ncbi:MULTISPECIES: phosphonoacetaldehyde hydrolase [unclassified Halomonas]|uniref:phosphonoacetaldehyde hydrolase n=1 Tax=unclassified Halomonas TaxID=2609666 RepID=UPI000990529D|nr:MULTISPECIES: phosphonoacetaldehyde hydrolase [unclassified Halomonas]AQU83948.1 phosphonoacetaldehyde hydrolase [Halomonas sp. 'Soap Lake \
MQYQSPQHLQAVISDWAGTLVDFGSFAPTQIFVEAFAELGVAISLEEARGPMGMGKWDHIRTLCNQPAIAARFAEAVGHTPTDNDVTVLYERFMPLQIAKIADHSAVIPGALDTLVTLRAQGLKVGSCSGYPAVVMEKVVSLAAANGLQLDHVVATDDVPNGRPHPAQALANVIALGISDVAACVKVDDTTPGILEGRSAGMWTVALTCSGNALGLTFDQYQALSEAERLAAHERVAAQFASSQPHYCIATIAELPGVVEAINRRLQQGERP